MTSDRQSGLAELERIEAMVTAVLMGDDKVQALAADGLAPSEERYVRAAAAIIAAFFDALANRNPSPTVTGVALWQRHLEVTNASRYRAT